MTSPTATALMAGLETDRFVLRNLGVAESFRLTRRYWLPDPEILAGVAPRLRTRSAVRWFLSMERPNRRTKFTHAIEDTSTGDVVGLNQIRLTAPSTAVMSVAIHNRNWWGKAVVPEIRAALIDALFGAGHVDRIAGQVLSRNLPAVFNYRALGFAHVGTLHRATQNAMTGEVDDVLIFELLKENWTGGAGRA